MGQVKKRGNRWRARYRRPDGTETSKSFARKVDAEQFLTHVEHSKLTGGYVDPSAGRVTFGAYAERWRAMQVHRPSTAVQVESNLRRHVLPFLGDRPIGAIRPSEIQAWVKGRSAVLAPATVELVYRYVVAIFRAAVADRLITASPCVGVKLPKIDRAHVVPPAPDVVEAIADALPGRYRALVVLAAGTGLRQGECFGLTVDRVDFLRRRLTVDRQLVLLPGAGGPVLAPPKTEASYRSVPLPVVVVAALAAHLAAFPAGTDGLVFTDDRGRPIRRTRFSDAWRPAVARAGVPGCRFHDLRHLYASLLIRHGESVKTVQARLGHASATETLDTYGHLWPDSEDRTREAVDAALGALASTLRPASTR
jgi:integrase